MKTNFDRADARIEEVGAHIAELALSWDGPREQIAFVVSAKPAERVAQMITSCDLTERERAIIWIRETEDGGSVARLPRDALRLLLPATALDVPIRECPIVVMDIGGSVVTSRRIIDISAN